MDAFKLLPNYSYNDYINWEGQWEIIDGIPYAMSPMPSPRHQRLSGIIYSYLFIELKKIETCNCQVYQTIDLKINENTVLNPDILIACKPINKQYLDFPPELVVEILSPSTKMKDLNTKFSLYENFKIKYYVIVDPEGEFISIFRLDQNGKYIESSPLEKIFLHDQCGLEINWQDLFLE